MVIIKKKLEDDECNPLTVSIVKKVTVEKDSTGGCTPPSSSVKSRYQESQFLDSRGTSVWSSVADGCCIEG
jgi:hypothetical protein